MGVYIKGMTLGELNDCIMAGAYIAPEDAIEVTEPHGDLVDRNEIDFLTYEDADGLHTEISAPTVIEAEDK